MCLVLHEEDTIFNLFNYTCIIVWRYVHQRKNVTNKWLAQSFIRQDKRPHQDPSRLRRSLVSGSKIFPKTALSPTLLYSSCSDFSLFLNILCFFGDVRTKRSWWVIRGWRRGASCSFIHQWLMSWWHLVMGVVDGFQRCCEITLSVTWCGCWFGFLESVWNL